MDLCVSHMSFIPHIVKDLSGMFIHEWFTQPRTLQARTLGKRLASSQQSTVKSPDMPKGANLCSVPRVSCFVKLCDSACLISASPSKCALSAKTRASLTPLLASMLPQRMTPGSASDIAYLWDITYNLEWSGSSGTAARFAADVTRLLDGDLGCCSVAESEGGVSDGTEKSSGRSNLSALRGIWDYWLRALHTLDVKDVMERR